ncbi:MAG: cupredoxin family copper-binding protein [Chloroflexota bacterium]|nr:cupredoxin family copper-binding protein [Chloroflexota bacterium]
MKTRTLALIGGGLLAGAVAFGGLATALAQTAGGAYGAGGMMGGGSGYGPGMTGGSGYGPGMMGGSGYGPGMMGGGSGHGPGMMGGGYGRPPASPTPASTPAAAGTSGTSPAQTTVEAQIVEPGGAAFSWGYSPATLTIHTGDTVTWTNAGSIAHSVTADDGSFDSGLLNHGASWSMTFSAAGTYTYHCAPHPWMKGTVVVQ